MKEILDRIHAISEGVRNITFMEVCGGHTHTIMKYGIRDILPKNIRLISGPGCPVCVSSQYDIDCMIELALSGVPVATYGDMLRVPGSKKSLDDSRAEGGSVHMVYSAVEVLALKDKYPDIVFFGIGFETTAPMTAFLLKKGIMVYSVHKTIPVPLKVLSQGDVKIDGFIDPGHVSTIIGSNALLSIPVPQAISGFEAKDILKGIYALVKMISEGKVTVVNTYPEAVTAEGNKKAQKLLKEYFISCDSEWRGLGMIPQSGLDVKDDSLNARVKYKKLFETVAPTLKTGCRCGDILQGKINPEDCPLFRKVCSPKNPQGACMVSGEGSCQIAYNFGK
jgi:hydrogenase expression/formation protein HypD